MSVLILQQPLDGSQANALRLWEIEMNIDCSTTCTMHAPNLDDRRCPSTSCHVSSFAQYKLMSFSDMQLLVQNHVKHWQL